MDFDPRDIDTRERDGLQIEELRWGNDPRDQDDRECDFDRDRGGRDHDPREPFVAALELPRCHERELVPDAHDHLYELNREDSLMLATIGAFRVVAERDLTDFHDADRTLDHLRDEGLIHTVQVDAGERAHTLTDRGLSVLEANRREPNDDMRGRDGDDRQVFHAGVSRERELKHDADLFRAYREVEAELRDRGGYAERIVLEVDLRREYQEWLQEHNRGRSDSDGRPDRTDGEIAEWALDHELPYRDGGVQFPDFRVEYELDGRDRHEDIEVVTGHYRGAHAAGRASSGFTCVRGGGTSRGSSPFDPHAAEDYL
jgi:DNA-binding PadR family transcriptional regulator